MGDVKLQQDLREWGRDALKRHQYDTAIYIGDKLLAITGASRTGTGSHIT
jgi:anaphase-promoting complex subunit 6